MIPSREWFFDGLAFFARRHALGAPFDPAVIAEGLAEAERLAGGRGRDEPAALFYACARRSRAFGPLAFVRTLYPSARRSMMRRAFGSCWWIILSKRGIR
jgi:hypothetical protein